MILGQPTHADLQISTCPECGAHMRKRANNISKRSITQAKTLDMGNPLPGHLKLSTEHQLLMPGIPRWRRLGPGAENLRPFEGGAISGIDCSIPPQTGLNQSLESQIWLTSINLKPWGLDIPGRLHEPANAVTLHLHSKDASMIVRPAQSQIKAADAAE